MSAKSAKFVPRACSVCGRVGRTKQGMCNSHYEQVRIHGSVQRVELLPATGVRVQGTYRTVHWRLGAASEHLCPCGRPAQQWAFDNQAPFIVDDESGCRFFPDPARYAAMCLRCHREQEGRRSCYHEDPDRYVWGACKECHRKRARDRAEKARAARQQVAG